MQNVHVLKRANSTHCAGKKKLNKKLAKRDWLTRIGAMTTTTINYTLPSGRTAIISITPTNFRGQIHAATTAMVDGVGSPILGGRTKPAGMPSWAVSCIGKLPLTAEIDAQVAAAESCINAAHSEHNAAAAAHVAELDAVTANSEMIAQRMAY